MMLPRERCGEYVFIEPAPPPPPPSPPPRSTCSSSFSTECRYCRRLIRSLYQTIWP